MTRTTGWTTFWKTLLQVLTAAKVAKVARQLPRSWIWPGSVSWGTHSRYAPVRARGTTAAEWSRPDARISFLPRFTPSQSMQRWGCSRLAPGTTLRACGRCGTATSNLYEDSCAAEG